MSCETLSTSLVGLTVSMGSLPEGFCPASMQELANAIAARLLVTPNITTSSFAIGSTEPSSNVGPWLKNCLEWYVFDDATGRYRPIPKGGFDTVEVFDATGAFSVPENVFKLKVEGWGGGGGGADNSGGNSSCGGGGGYGMKIFDVFPGQTFTVTVGAPGSRSSPAGSDGGDTIFSTMTCGGGKGGTNATNSPGDGGATTGADIAVQGGAGAPGDPTVGRVFGHGGDSPNGGSGGAGSATVQSHFTGKLPGGGGCGGFSGTFGDQAGNGAGGRIVIQY